MSYKKKTGSKSKIIDTKHKNPYNPFFAFPKAFYSGEERKIIFGNIREHNGILYGSSSAKLQAPSQVLSKPYTDIDCQVKSPRTFAVETERELDNWIGFNNYYVEEMTVDSPYGYGRKVFRIHNRARGDEVIADVVPTDKKPKTTVIDGMRVETLASREQAIRRMLKKPENVYRRKRDIQNLGYVIHYRKQKKMLKPRKRKIPYAIEPLIIFKKDRDFDGVEDSKDCEPDNYWKQHDEKEYTPLELMGGKHRRDEEKRRFEQEETIKRGVEKAREKRPPPTPTLLSWMIPALEKEAEEQEEKIRRTRIKHDLWGLY